MKYRYYVKLLEAFNKKQIDDIIKNYSSIRKMPFSKKLQDTLIVDETIFEKIVSSPEVYEILPKKDFIKILNSMQTTESLLIRLKFMLLALATGYYDRLGASYEFHPIKKELPDHYLLRINGDYSMRFRPDIEDKKIYIKDIKSHAGRGY